MVNYVLDKTNRSSVNYVGHSMGGALFMIMVATHPKIVTKIKSTFLLAPAMVIGNSFSKLIKTGSFFAPWIQGAFRLLHLNGFLLDQPYLQANQENILTYPGIEFHARWIYFAVMGPNSGETDIVI